MGCAPRLVRTLFNRNSAMDGGAIDANFSALPLMASYCVFQENSAGRVGGAISAEDCPVALNHCTFLDNSSEGMGGGISGYYASATIVSCTFLGNASAYGGAIESSMSVALELTSCTLVANSAPMGAGLSYDYSGPPILTQTIIAFGVGGDAVRCESAEAADLSCCDIFGNEGGDWVGPIAGQLGADGNISADPLFCDSEIWDLHLQATSPCGGDSTDCGLMGAWPEGCP
jgi:predicted outer membrane repeat protein